MSKRTFCCRQVFVLSLLLLALTAACTDTPKGTREPTDVTDIREMFVLEETIQLEEPPGTPLAEVTALARASNGDFYVVDRPSHQVRVHTPRGRLLRILGGYGQGPGELAGPIDVAVTSGGQVFVAEADNGRISVFQSEKGTFDTLWTPPTPLPFSIRLHPRGLLVGSYTDVGPQYSLLSPHGQLLAAFYQRDPRIGTTPYWNSVNRDYATVLGDAVIAGSSLLYPLRRFGPDGQLLGEFGIRPPSWRAAPEPDAGAFARGLADAPKLKRWLSSFTMITDIRSMSDSLILVAHGRFGAALEESNSMASLLRIHEESFDAYRPDGSRIAAEIRLPGDLVYTDETLYVLTAGPPAPWTISRYRLHGPPGR